MRRFILLPVVLLLLALSGFTVPTAQAQTGIYATVVNANYLNVRTAPSTTAGVVAVIIQGYSYPVLGRTADSGWWMLQLPPTGLVGWASGWFLSIPNQQAVPVVASPSPTPSSLSMGTVNTGNLNVRVTPDPYNGAIITKISGGQIYSVIGRNNIGTRWYQLRLTDGSSGWVNGNYLIVTNESLVPVTDSTTNPGSGSSNGAYGTVTAYFLNVRSTPNPYVYNILTIISRSQTFPVIGRNAAGTWWQINLGNGLTGWVNGSYFPVVNGQYVPITG